MRTLLIRWILAMGLAGIGAWRTPTMFAADVAPPPQVADTPEPAAPPTMANAKPAEIEALNRLLMDKAWPRRAIGVMRLQRYTCDRSRDIIEAHIHDRAWQVRTFALWAFAQRQEQLGSHLLEREEDPRVVRAALRCRYPLSPERLSRAVRALARSHDSHDRLLAAELGSLSGDKELVKLATEAAKQVILKMNRIQAGEFTPRLARITGQTKLYRPYEWQQWLMKTGRRFELKAAYFAAAPSSPPVRSNIAQLEAESFIGLENYMTKLSEREVDVAILLDCTASMGREIAAAQAGIDDLVLFVGDVVSSLQVALVGYRDRHDEFEIRPWDFTSDLATIRQQLWQLSADGGGDEPESVHAAMRTAITRFNWRPDAQKVLMIVGDAPPHVGSGALCVELAKRGKETAELLTHTIQVKNKPVKHFDEIAAAGGGRCVSLKDADTLIAEITGLTLGDRYEDEFREFFRIYLQLCR